MKNEHDRIVPAAAALTIAVCGISSAIAEFNSNSDPAACITKRHTVVQL